MSRRTREERDAQIMHEVTSRAIRRLDVLEWVILAGAVVLAAGGGAAVAWLIAPTIEPGVSTYVGSDFDAVVHCPGPDRAHPRAQGRARRPFENPKQR